jgi:hypothetical protein
MLVRIQLRLIQDGAQGLKRIGCARLQILVSEWYLKEDQESHGANKDGVHNSGAEVAERDALTELLQDREHQDPVCGVASDS